MKLVREGNFLDLEAVVFEEAKVLAVPFGLELTTTYGQGTAKGPDAIIEASQHLEFFDEELWWDIRKDVLIGTLPIQKITGLAQARKKLEAILKEILGAKKFPVILGGDHGLTPLVIENYKKNGFKDFSILQFDAHADLRDGYLGQKYSHAAAMRRCLDNSDLNLVQVGIRSISRENNELEFWEKNQSRVKTFWAKDKRNWKIQEMVKGLKDNVYITFDVDALDPSIMPSTGTPEPGGMDWDLTLDILRAVCEKKKIIGADFVELAPIKNLPAPDFLVAKLIYKLIGYTFKK